jgi:zinc protease
MINRTLAPENNALSKPQLLYPKKHKTSNGIAIYSFNAPGSQVIQIEWVFAGGQLKQVKPLQATFTGQLISEGTRSYSSVTISETIDFYGASFHVESDINHQTLVLSCTKESLAPILPIISEMVTFPTFNDKEFSLQINTGKERFKVNTQKVDFVSRQYFNTALYGNNSILGKLTTLEDYDLLNTNDLKDFFEKNIAGSLEHIIAAGDIDESVIQLLTDFTTAIESVKPIEKSKVLLSIPKTTRLFYEVENAMQSSIRIGFNAIPRSHDDFPALQVANMILGGYFGSRLMSNIREDKGYTYGIGSSLMALTHAGYLAISTEVGANVTEAAVGEIHKEIKIMCEEPVENDELELARNYMIGSFIRNSDGVFAMADRFKAVFYSDLDYAYYDHYFNVIENISAEEIMQVSKQYLDKPFIEIIAGGK